MVNIDEIKNNKTYYFIAGNSKIISSEVFEVEKPEYYINSDIFIVTLKNGYKCLGDGGNIFETESEAIKYLIKDITEKLNESFNNMKDIEWIS